ncbi:hypothetical protein KC367_g73 [Hortaea werneckii]|nr:hypothetical protein KC367_g73 [Hortaea werneckii]
MTSQILRRIPATRNRTDRRLLFTGVLAIDDSLILIPQREERRWAGRRRGEKKEETYLKSKIQNQSNNEPHANHHGTRDGIEILPGPALDQRHPPHVDPIPPAGRQQGDDGIHDGEGAGDVVVLAGGVEEAEGEGGE